MREARIKIPVESGDAVYHCISRVVNGERVLDEPAREVLRKQLWQVAEFCGVRIHTYAILSNHFHVLLMVPQRAPVSDVELLRRYRRLYPTPPSFKLPALMSSKLSCVPAAPKAMLGANANSRPWATSGSS